MILSAKSGTGISRKAYRISTNGKVTIHQFNPVNDRTFIQRCHLAAPCVGLEVNNTGLSAGLQEFVSIQAGFLPGSCTTDGDCGGAPFVCGDTGTCNVLSIFTAKMSLIATEMDATALTINAPVDVEIADTNGTSTVYPTGQAFELNLTQGDVLTLSTTEVDDADLSGMTVISDKKVAVFSTNTCAMIPHGPMHATTSNNNSFPQPPGVRVRRSEIQTSWYRAGFLAHRCQHRQYNIYHDPTVPELENLTLNAGQMVQFHSTESFHLLATAPVSVARIMVGLRLPRANWWLWRGLQRKLRLKPL